MYDCRTINGPRVRIDIKPAEPLPMNFTKVIL